MKIIIVIGLVAVLGLLFYFYNQQPGTLDGTGTPTAENQKVNIPQPPALPE